MKQLLAGLTGCFLLVIILIMVLTPFFGYRLSGLTGSSMSPTLTDQDIVLINTRYNYQDLKEGDIITFKDYFGEYVTHRIIKISENHEWVETKGDSNQISDLPLVKPPNIVGKVLIIPKGGILVRGGIFPLVGIWIFLIWRVKKFKSLASASASS